MIDRPGGAKENPPPPRRPLFRLLRDLADDASRLIRQEIHLLQAEMFENVRRLARHSTQTAVGGVLALLGGLVLVQFLVVGLGVLLGGAYWLSSLLVALALILAGAAIGYLGVRRLGSSKVAPEEAIESARETQRWLGRELQDLQSTLRADGSLASGMAISGRGPAAPGEGSLVLRSTGGSAGEVALREEWERGQVLGSPRRPLSEPLVRRVFHEIMDDDVLGQAARVAFFMFTSLPPALLVLFALSGMLGTERFAAFVTEKLESALPGSVDDPNSAAAFVSEFVQDVVSGSAPAPLSIGLILGLWAASAVFVALTETLNRVFDVRDSRSWLRRRALSLGVMLVFLLLFIVGSAILIAGPQIAGMLQLGGVAEVTWNIVQWPLAFLLVVLAFFLVYYVLPNRDQSIVKRVLFLSSAIAAGLWLIATLGFRLYIANFGSYGETYGFVGAILVLLLWMYLTAIVILVGGEISSEMERTA